MAENKTIILKLLVDKKKNKVVFAEVDKDFVDVLFSFLTIPIGTIVRLAKKQSKLGCMDALYKSVEALDRKNFETEAFKSMLLMPRNAYEYKNRNLVVDVCTYPLYYICPTWTCVTETTCLLSMFENTKCHCTTNMDKPVLRKPQKITEGDELNGVFVKGNKKFIISDDLVVREVCNETSLSTLCHFNIEEARSAEERIVSVGANQVLKLLFRSLLSTTPLSDVFLSNKKWVDAIMKRSVSLDIRRVLNLLFCSLLSKTPLSDVLLSKRKWISPNMIRSESVDIKPQVPRTALDTKMGSLTLLIKKPNKILYMGKRNKEKVVYAAAKENFLDFLFSFLGFPMGSALELLGRDSSIRSIDNLYKSVEDMRNGNPAQFKECNDILLHPKVAAHHSCENQLLQMEEEDLRVTTVLKCLTCIKGKVAVDQGGVCGHGLDRGKLSFVNPKFLDTVVKRGNGFLKKSRMFMVTDELIVEPLSPISSVSFVNKLGVPLSELEERIVSVGEKVTAKVIGKEFHPGLRNLEWYGSELPRQPLQLDSIRKKIHSLRKSYQQLTRMEELNLVISCSRNNKITRLTR
ncbi:hypothetical protein IFM89_002644 [Coptis chinensis]|uniref:DUF674 family protein n=1 Tax=Coptis chinensis TaxID=261450 RepID=A0A835MCJ6_9MAGN|nr:hypothetical protein IFM89_002644 [Coptis chinensis]